MGLVATAAVALALAQHPGASAAGSAGRRGSPSARPHPIGTPDAHGSSGVHGSTGTPGPSAAASSPSPSTTAAGCRPASTVLGPEVRRYLATRSSLVSAALWDARTGKTFLFRPGIRFDTGSIVKVQIMGTLLHDLQQDGHPPTADEAEHLRLMIEISDNDSATALWDEVGGPDAVAAFDRLAGMSHTTPNPLGYWGDTRTTALDNVRLIRHFAFPNGVLDDEERRYGMSLMRRVTPSERWGVSFGVPDSTDVALKNGWLPIASGDWEINSIGVVHGFGRRYVLAMLSHRNPTMDYGVETLDRVSSMVWNELACDRGA